MIINDPKSAEHKGGRAIQHLNYTSVKRRDYK